MTAVGLRAEPGRLEARLRARREEGRKLLLPYVSGGITAGWTDILLAMAAAGADAIEVGIPFSDPVMDGPTIQEASLQALGRGTTPASIMDDLRAVADDIDVPIIAMTYANIAFRAGARRFAAEAVAAGFSGVIIPDIPMEELDEWQPAAEAAGLETVLLASPISSDARLERLCGLSRGFVYGVNLLGVTGERATVDARGQDLARRLKAITDLPVVMGFGVSTPEQARELTGEADGVVVASAIMRRVLDGPHPKRPAGSWPSSAPPSTPEPPRRGSPVSSPVGVHVDGDHDPALRLLLRGDLRVPVGRAVAPVAVAGGERGQVALVAAVPDRALGEDVVHGAGRGPLEGGGPVAELPRVDQVLHRRVAVGEEQGGPGGGRRGGGDGGGAGRHGGGPGPGGPGGGGRGCRRAGGACRGQQEQGEGCGGEGSGRRHPRRRYRCPVGGPARLPAGVGLEQRRELVEGDRLREVVALPVVAPDAAQVGELGARLDPLGGGAQAERAG